MTTEIDKYVAPQTDKGLNQYVAVLLKLKKSVGENLFAIGGLLKEIKENKLYAEQHDSFNEFLGDPEVSLSRSVAYKAMTIYEVYFSRMQEVCDIDQDKLYLLAENVKADPSKIEDFISEARLLSRSDLREKYGKRPHKVVELEKQIEQFIADIFPGDRRKKFIKEVVEEWENYAP